MTKYHISNDGVPRRCEATKGKCPIGADAHGEFDNEIEARKFAEEYNEKKHAREEFMKGAKKIGESMREQSEEAHLDEFAGLTPEEIKAALTNPGTKIAFNEDGSLRRPPTGTLQDPYDLADLTGDQARAYLLSKGYDPERIAKLEADFKGDPDLSQRALITAATVDLMVGPPQGHVRFSQDPDDNYSFSMTNFSEVGQAVGMIDTDPNTGFLVPAKDPKAALSWMQVSNPANNVFMLQEHLGINRLFMPQTANSGVTGETRSKLEEAAAYIENNRHRSPREIMRDKEFADLNRDLQLKPSMIDALHAGEYGVKRGVNLDRNQYLDSLEVNGAEWMARDFQENYGFRSEVSTYGMKELSAMKPTQSGISVLQVQGMAQGTLNSYIAAVKAEEAAGNQVTAARSQEIFDSVMGKRTIVTEDDYIIDGHHGLAKAALLNTFIKSGSFERLLRKEGLSVPVPTEARLGVLKLNMDGGQAFDAVTYWTESKGFPVSGMK